MKKVELSFGMVYENSLHTETVEVDDDTTAEELEEMAREMVLDYANIYVNEVKDNGAEE